MKLFSSFVLKKTLRSHIIPDKQFYCDCGANGRHCKVLHNTTNPLLPVTSASSSCSSSSSNGGTSTPTSPPSSSYSSPVSPRASTSTGVSSPRGEGGNFGMVLGMTSATVVGGPYVGSRPISPTPRE
jgi:hypothetical protein